MQWPACLISYCFQKEPLELKSFFLKFLQEKYRHIEMMPLAQNSRVGKQGRLSPQDEEGEEEVEQMEVESFDASPAESAASMQAFLW